MSDAQLKLLYSEMQKKLIEYHNEEEFDHLFILVLRTLLSTILQQYGVQTYDSNLDCNNRYNLYLYIIFFPISSIWPEYTNHIHSKQEILVAGET